MCVFVNLDSAACVPILVNSLHHQPEKRKGSWLPTSVLRESRWRQPSAGQPVWAACQRPIFVCAWDTNAALLRVEPETWKAAAILQHSRAEISGSQVTGESVLGQSSWRRQPLPLLFTSLNVCLLVKPYLMVRTLYSSLLGHWRKNLIDTHSLRPAPQLHSLSGQSKEAQNCILMLHGVRIEG